jgi:hypothetical protein
MAAVTLGQRLGREEQAKRKGPQPRGQDVSPVELIDATERGLWTLIDWRAALGEEQIASFRRDVASHAFEAQERRLAGDRPWLGLPTDVAAEILSYRPDELVPDEYAGLLDRHLTGQHVPVLVHYLAGAALAAIVLDTRDGIELRRRIWAEHQTSADID